MSQTAKVQEPSMEEILASIRRIIADDDASKAAKPPEPTAAAASRPAARASLPPAPTPAAVANSQDEIDAMLAKFDAPADAPAGDVLDLTEAMAAPAPAESPTTTPAFRTIDASSDIVFTDRPLDAPAEPALRIIEEPRRPVTPAPLPPTAEPVVAPRPAQVPERPLISPSTIAAVDSAFNTLAHTVIGQNARTLEDLVKEMLRPLLKSWLDDNLPSLVERIVRAEIERVSRGR